MVDYKKYEKDLLLLIKHKKLLDYVELFKYLFTNINEKQDIDNFISLLLVIENEHKIYEKIEVHKEYKELLLILRETLKVLLSNGAVPHLNYIHLFTLYTSHQIEEDSILTSFANFFKEDILNLKWDNKDKLVENDLIFLIEILNGNGVNAIYQYLKQIYTLKINNNGSNYKEFLASFTLLNNINIDIILDTIMDSLEFNKYMALTLGEKKSLLSWIYEILINFSKYSKNIKTQQLYPQLKKIIYSHIKNKDTDELMTVEFLTMIINATTFQTPLEFKELNEEITKPCGDYYLKYGTTHSLLKIQKNTNSKIKIAFLFERFVMHAPFKIVYALLEKLQSDKQFTEKYEIEVYSLHYYFQIEVIDEIMAMLNKINVKIVFPLNSYLEKDIYCNRLQRAIKIREEIINNQVDITIACFDSYDILGFLFATRTAPKQIFWSHGNQNYNVPNIDIYLTHMHSNKINYQCFRVNKIIDVGTKQEDEEGLKIKKKILSKYPKNTLIIGTIGRLIKIDNKEYIKTIAKVLNQNPNTIYLACGSGNTSSIQKLLKEYNIESSRFLFPGHINPNIYGAVIDIWADSFPLRQGSSKGDFLARGKSFVTNGLYYTEEHLNNFTNHYKGIEPLPIAFSKQEYIDLLTLTITDKNYREMLGNLAYKDAHNSVIETEKFISILEKD